MERFKRTTYFWAGWAGVILGLFWSYWAGRDLLDGIFMPPLIACAVIPLTLGLLFIRRSRLRVPDTSLE
ncbi:MAG: hypothetical protein Q8M65_11295 [Rhodoglobus sp.]|nr:hypothetical protein [Rhodoglobus sp.]